VVPQIDCTGTVEERLNAIPGEGADPTQLYYWRRNNQPALDGIDPKFAQLESRSLSDRELVLAFSDALQAIDLLEVADIQVAGWEGWIRLQDGRVGHSGLHQGTPSLARLSVADAASVSRRTIRLSQANWDEAPEVEGAGLYFCITY
jgi:hypothetical protein